MRPRAMTPRVFLQVFLLSILWLTALTTPVPSTSEAAYYIDVNHPQAKEGSGQANGEGDIRAICIQSRSTNTPQMVDAVLDRVIQGGFDTIIYGVWSGEVYYKSKLLPWSPYVTAEYDPLAYVVEQGHARGLKVQAWWMPGVAPENVSFRNRYPGWDIADLDEIPDDMHWLNFSLPEVRQFVGDVVLEIAGNYDVDAVLLDYIRYPDPNVTNIDLAPLGFSATDISLTVQGAYQRLKVARPDVLLTAGVGRNLEGIKLWMQLWPDWLAGDYIDYVIPMLYFDPDRTHSQGDGKSLEDEVASYQHLPLNRLVPALYCELFDRSRNKTPEEFFEQIAVCEAGGLDSLVVFDEEKISDELLDALQPIVLPTSTPMPTNTPSPTATSTPLPTNTPTLIPTNTPTPTNTPVELSIDEPLFASTTVVKGNGIPEALVIVRDLDDPRIFAPGSVNSEGRYEIDLTSDWKIYQLSGLEAGHRIQAESEGQIYQAIVQTQTVQILLPVISKE